MGGPQIWTVSTATLLGVALGLVLLTPKHNDLRYPPPSIAIKGGDLALTVVREREGRIVENPILFAQGDRFSLRITCPPQGSVQWEAVVFQNDRVYFPLEAGKILNCGNHRPLRGAFRLTGNAPTQICVSIGDKLPSRKAIVRNGIDALPQNTVCTELRPFQ